MNRKKKKENEREREKEKEINDIFAARYSPWRREMREERGVAETVRER